MISTLLFVLKTTVFMSGTEWFINVGFRVHFSELLSLLFLLIYFFHILNGGVSTRLSSGFRLIVGLAWIRFVLATCSGGNLLFDSILENSYSLFWKNELQLFAHTIFIQCMAKFLNDQPEGAVRELLPWYFLGPLFSSAYGILQPIVFNNTGVDFDVVTWRLLGVELPPDMGIARYSYGAFYRIKGWSMEPNVLASYIVTGLPILLLPKICYEKLKSIFIAILGVAITLSMSVSGSIALSFALAYLAIKNNGFRFKLAKLLVFLVVPIVSLFLFFPVEADNFVRTRLGADAGSKQEHLAVISDAFDFFVERPWGYGFGSFSQVYEKNFGIVGYNSHSSWMTYLVEEGIQGLILQLIILAVFVKEALHRKCLESDIFIASYVGICIGAMFYNTLTIFYAYIYPILMLSVITKKRSYHV